MNIPTSEKELEVYFKLKELEDAKNIAGLPLSMHGTINIQQFAIDRYNSVKKEYFELVNKLTPTAKA